METGETKRFGIRILRFEKPIGKDKDEVTRRDWKLVSLVLRILEKAERRTSHSVSRDGLEHAASHMHQERAGMTRVGKADDSGRNIHDDVACGSEEGGVQLSEYPTQGVIHFSKQCSWIVG